MPNHQAGKISFASVFFVPGINITIKAKPLIYRHFKNRCTTYVQRFYNLSSLSLIKLSDLRLYSSIK